MTKRDFDGEFKEIMIGEAARDERLRGVNEYLLLGKTALVSDQFLEDTDPNIFFPSIATHYALDECELKIAISICEDLIMEEAWYV